MKLIRAFFYLFLCILSCNDSYKEDKGNQYIKKIYVKKVEPDSISLILDSFSIPNVMHTFRIKMRIINKYNKKVILIFNKKDNVKDSQYRDFYVVNKKDTFNIGINENYIVVDEKSEFSILAFGYFYEGKNAFKDFGYSEKNSKALSNGKIVYELDNNFSKEIESIISIEKLNRYDTIYLPIFINSDINNIQIVRSTNNTPWKRKLID